MKLPVALLYCIVIMFGCSRSAFKSTTHPQASEVPYIIPTESQNAEVQQANEVETSEIKIAPASCDKKDQVVNREFVLNFTERKQCPYELNDNLAAKSGVMTARNMQELNIELVPNAEICSFELLSSASDLHYDDYLFLTVNNIVLIASEQGWANLLPEQNKIKSWDWLTLKGKKHADIEQSAAYGKPYCYGDPACSLPKHDAVGNLRYTLSGKEFKSFALETKMKNYAKFSVIATGDDDLDDCDHSTFKLTLRLNYVNL